MMSSDAVQESSATLKGKPVGEASLSVFMISSHLSIIPITWFLRSYLKPDSLDSANIEPAWMPFAPKARAFSNHSGEAYTPASQ